MMWDITSCQGASGREKWADYHRTARKGQEWDLIQGVENLGVDGQIEAFLSSRPGVGNKI